MSSLSSFERNRIERFVFKRDIKFSLSGQLLAKLAVSELLNLEWDKISFQRTENGRLFLDNISNEYMIDFNISHSGDYTILAAIKFPKNLNMRIGCDIMCVPGVTTKNGFEKYQRIESEFNKIRSILNSEFTQREKDYVLSESIFEDKIIAFNRLWCLKESFIKAIGLGLKFDLKRTESFINSKLNLSKICTDSKMYVDSIELNNFKFYEHVYIDSKPESQFHIMTICIENNSNHYDKVFEIDQPFTEISETKFK